MDLREYHLNELRIAENPADPRRILPPIRATHRRILDVGCGAGQTLIASRLGPEVEAVGVDLAPAALALGKELDGRIHFVCARGEALPLPSDYFDLVFSRVTIPYMRTRAALVELCRVLRCNGTLWMTLHPFSFVARTFARDLARLDLLRAAYRLYVITNGLAGHLFDREFACPFTGGRHESFQTRQRIIRYLTELGCVDIDVSQDDQFFVVMATKRAQAGHVH